MTFYAFVATYWPPGAAFSETPVTPSTVRVSIETPDEVSADFAYALIRDAINPGGFASWQIDRDSAAEEAYENRT